MTAVGASTSLLLTQRSISANILASSSVVVVGVSTSVLCWATSLVRCAFATISSWSTGSSGNLSVLAGAVGSDIVACSTACAASSCEANVPRLIVRPSRMVRAFHFPFDLSKLTPLIDGDCMEPNELVLAKLAVKYDLLTGGLSRMYFRRFWDRPMYFRRCPNVLFALFALSQMYFPSVPMYFSRFLSQ